MTGFIGSPETQLRRANPLSRSSQFLQDNFVWVLWVLLVVGATLANPVFLTGRNLINITIAGAPLALLVLAQSVVLITGNMDLSTEANMVFTAVVAGILLQPPSPPDSEAFGGLGWHWGVVIPIMLAIGMLIGAVNGFTIAYLRMNPFMTTLAMLVLLSGLALHLGQGRRVINLPREFVFVGAASVGPFPLSLFVLVIIFIGAAILLNRLKLGRHLYAVGGARFAARNSGIDDRRVILSAYLISGALCMLAAFILVGRLGTAGPSISSGQLFISIAAAVVGGVSLFGGIGTVSGMLGGLLLMASITNALNLSNVPSTLVNVVTGVIIFIAVFVDAMRMRSRTTT